MSILFIRALLLAGAPLVLVSPAAATDLLDYDFGYPRQGYLDPAYERPYGAYAGYRPDYRDIARYCEPDDWAVANGYVPPTWCFPGRPAQVWGRAGLPPAPGCAQRDYPYRARYGIDVDPLR